MASPAQLAARAAIIPAAIASMQATGVPASVTIAQWEIESTWGTSKLALLANNFFGIKAEHLSDPSTYMEFPTPEYIDGVEQTIEADFEKYPDAASSFADHARLLSVSPRYAPAMLEKGNAYYFANALQACGYSTNRPPAPPPNYKDIINQIIFGSNLTQYDK